MFGRGFRMLYHFRMLKSNKFCKNSLGFQMVMLSIYDNVGEMSSILAPA